MKSILPEILEDLTSQQGVEPLFFLRIDWTDGDIWYSTKEFLLDVPTFLFDPELPVDFNTTVEITVHSYVDQFLNYQHVQHKSGYQRMSNISIILNDMFGHFRERFDTQDIFTSNLVATIYLSTFARPELVHELFNGRIQSDPVWSEDRKTLEIEVSAELQDQVIGYTPRLDDVIVPEMDPEDENYDAEAVAHYFFVKNHLLNNNWPSVYGSCIYEVVPVYNIVNIEVTEEMIFSETDLQLSNDGGETLDTPTQVVIVGDDKGPFHLLANGEFKEGNIFHIEDTRTDTTKYWYKDIQFSVVNEELTQFGDDIEDQGLTDTTFDQSDGIVKILISPGSFTDELGPHQTTGPDGEDTDEVFLQFMTLEIFYRIQVSAVLILTTKSVRCVRQEGNICTITGLDSIPAAATALRIVTAGKYEGRISRINKGAHVYPSTAAATYIVGLGDDIVVNEVKIAKDDGFMVLDPSTYTIATTQLWPGFHPPVTHLTISMEGILRYAENFTEDSIKDGVFVDVTRVIEEQDEGVTSTTLKLAVKDLNINFGSGIGKVIGLDNLVDFVLLEEEDVPDILGEIVWASGAVVRETVGLDPDFIPELGETFEDDAPIVPVLEIVDLVTPEVPFFAFTDENIQTKSLQYGFTPLEDVKTHMTIDFLLTDYSKPVQQVFRKNNDTIYGENVLNADLYTLRRKSVVDNVADFWIDRLSTPRRRVKFNAFLEALSLEVYDRVSVDFTDPAFYDASKGSPLTYTHDPTTEPWRSEGFITEINPRILEGIIEITIVLDGNILSTPTRTIRDAEPLRAR